MAAIILLVIVAFFFAAPQSGTLAVEAVSSGRYYSPVQLAVTARVGQTSQTTPFNLTLSQGEYTVTYGNLSWYITPPPRSVDLIGGKLAYALGTYVPVVVAISLTQNGFNTTSVTTKHGVTPVVWVNIGNTPEILLLGSVGRISLDPSQNYTHVFASQGTYDYSILGTSLGGTVDSV